MSTGRPDASLEWTTAHPTDVRLTLSPLRRGRDDPTFQVARDGALWRTTRAPEGPATLRLASADGGGLRAEGWGPGARWAVETAPALLGAADDPGGFTPPERLARLHRKYVGLRVPRTSRVLESLVPAVFEQKVIGVQAQLSWRTLVMAFGEPAPGPAGMTAGMPAGMPPKMMPPGMMVVPDARTWRRIPSWEWHRAGVDPSRMRTVISVCRYHAELEHCADLPLADAYRRLLLQPGIGPWTAAETADRALGDADAVSVGDYHLPKMVGYALHDERDFTDEQMLAALAPYRPHRQRVVRLIELSGSRPPRRGPRMAKVDHTWH